MNFFLIRFRISSYLNILSHFQMLPHNFLRFSTNKHLFKVFLSLWHFVYGDEVI